MTRILVTGATGFVGRHIIRALGSADVKLLPVVRMGKEDEVAGLSNIESVISTHDLFAESESWWEQQCHGTDIVIHAAWYAEPGKYLQAPQNIDCLIGSLRLAKGAAKSRVKRLVGIGTCFEYDLAHGVLSVDTPLKPLTVYAACKASLYLTLSQWWLPSQSGGFVWCRLFYLFGEGEDERRLVPYIRKKLENGQPADLTSGEQIRDFMDVSIAGRMIAEIALSDRTGPINICSGFPITVRQLAEQVADEYGQKTLLNFGARPENLVDPPCILGVPNA